MAYFDYAHDEEIIERAKVGFKICSKADVKKKLAELGLVQDKLRPDYYVFPDFPEVNIFRLGAKYIYYTDEIALVFSNRRKQARIVGQYMSIYSGNSQRFPMHLATDEVLTAFLSSVRKALDEQIQKLKEKIKEVEKNAILED